MAYNNEIIQIPASHIRQGYTNDIVVSNFIKQVTATVTENSLNLDNQAHSVNFNIYTKKEDVDKYTTSLSDYENLMEDNDYEYLGEKYSNNPNSNNSYNVFAYFHKQITFSSRAIINEYSSYYTFNSIEYQYIDATESVNEDYGATVYTGTAFSMGSGAYNESFYQYASLDAMETNIFNSDGYIISGDRNIAVGGIIPYNNSDTVFDIYILLRVREYNSSSTLTKFYLSYSFNLRADLLEATTTEVAYPDSDINSNYAYALESNELTSFTIARNIANKIIEARENGLATAELSVAILKYYDIYGNLIIDPEASDKEHLFKQGMRVQPWINETTPLAYTNTNEPMNFYVNFADFDFSGVGKQNLKLIEDTRIIEEPTPPDPSIYASVTINWTTGVDFVRSTHNQNYPIENGVPFYVEKNEWIYVIVVPLTGYTVTAGGGMHYITEDTVINIITQLTGTATIYEASVSNISTNGCTVFFTYSRLEITPTGNDWYSFSTAAYDFDDNKSYEIVIEGLRPLVDYTTIDGSISVVADSTSFGEIRKLSDITFESNNPVNWSLQFYGDSEYDFNRVSFNCPPNAIAFTRMYIIEQSVT